MFQYGALTMIAHEISEAKEGQPWVLFEWGTTKKDQGRDKESDNGKSPLNTSCFENPKR